MPKLFIISGCNGAGKTTASYTILPEMLNCAEFVNADEIAKELDPFAPEHVALRASKLMLERMRELIGKKTDFAIETTLAPKSLRNIILDAQEQGYSVTLVYFWLNVPQLAIERVKLRVASGGHNVDEAVIIRRYYVGLKNLLKMYIPIVDYWITIDNSSAKFEIIAEGGKQVVTKIHNKTLYNLLINYERIGDSEP
ncbi:MAG: zeta toxin family protein [Bacteroidales bacterium]|jgi:predicted ABC-type ATPase|nr:zeta toxin family protein [Bacteroidales bacterium]MCI2122163.1 zeta toxin family protein [Bacteroidales bacterium]MCI2144683.1 zeta toxin family protein [Bacteroidales bacterium]